MHDPNNEQRIKIKKKRRLEVLNALNEFSTNLKAIYTQQYKKKRGIGRAAEVQKISLLTARIQLSAFARGLGRRGNSYRRLQCERQDLF